MGMSKYTSMYLVQSRTGIDALLSPPDSAVDCRNVGNFPVCLIDGSKDRRSLLYFFVLGIYLPPFKIGLEWREAFLVKMIILSQILLPKISIENPKKKKKPQNIHLIYICANRFPLPFYSLAWFYEYSEK